MAYTRRPGDPCLAPPGHLVATWYIFVLAAPHARLDDWIDRNIRRTTGLDYRPLSGHVLLAWTDIPKLWGDTDAQIGAIAYNDIALWIPMVAPDGDRIVFTPPYIFVDNVQALVTGREIYGLPKDLGWFQMPTSPSDVDHLVTEVSGTARPGDTVERQLLWEIRRTGDGSASRSWRDALRVLRQTLGAGSGVRTRAMLEPLRQLNILGVKQFRAAADPTSACFRSVIEAPVTVRRRIAAGALRGRFQFLQADLASHPVARELGVVSQEVQAACWVEAEVTLEVGHAVVARPWLPRRRRVAILGGGMGGLAAALALTKPGQGHLVDVTVYELGWRLGGKGASGRNAALGQRIEEHGVHVWFGFYASAFALMREVYEELGRPAGAPLATLEEAFTPLDYLAAHETYADRLVRWRIRFPNNGESPGDEDGDPSWRIAVSLTHLVPDMVERVLRSGRLDDAGQVRDRGRVARALSVLRKPIWLALRSVRDPNAAEATRALEALRGALRPLAKRRLSDDLVRFTWYLVDSAAAGYRGLVDDALLERGAASIDDEDFRDWLVRHGAERASVDGCPLVRCMYDALFAYEDGDHARPRLAAGSALQLMAGALLGYGGSVMYRMEAGMGDVVFAPIYKVLRRRGVRFEFFHQVDALRTDGDRISAVEMTARATGPAPYEPLVHIDGLPCWPSEPLWAQLHDAERLRTTDLEHPGPGAEKRVLRCGEDFDEVVLAIPVGALPSVAGDLAAADARWQALFTELATVATQAAQLWLTPGLEALGWEEPPPVASGLPGQLDTWIDMSQLVAREGHPDVGSIAYFCGVLHDVAPPGTVHQSLETLKTEVLPRLWPSSTGPISGEHVRENTRGTHRYVQSLPGTHRVRLRPHDTGFANLVVAGDWTDNGLNVGCIEGTVRSGLLAAAALWGQTPALPEPWLIPGGRPTERPAVAEPQHISAK